MREASYSLTYGERGSSVAFIASEPITGSNTDWVAVPKNTALVITREKGGYISILRSPLLQYVGVPGELRDPVQQEVATCLEVSGWRLEGGHNFGWVSRSFVLLWFGFLNSKRRIPTQPTSNRHQPTNPTDTNRRPNPPRPLSAASRRAAAPGWPRRAPRPAAPAASTARLGRRRPRR
jgi:hypothetical protein